MNICNLKERRKGWEKKKINNSYWAARINFGPTSCSTRVRQAHLGPPVSRLASLSRGPSVAASMRCDWLVFAPTPGLRGSDALSPSTLRRVHVGPPCQTHLLRRNDHCRILRSLMTTWVRTRPARGGCHGALPLTCGAPSQLPFARSRNNLVYACAEKLSANRPCELPASLRCMSTLLLIRTPGPSLATRNQEP